MGILRFYWLVLCTAFTRSLSVAQDVLFACIVILGAAIYWAPGKAVTLGVPSWVTALGGAQIIAATFAAIFAVRLLWAPYWVWQDEKEARNEAEAKIIGAERKREIRVALGTFLTRAQALMTRCANADDSKVPDDVKAWAADLDAFVYTYLDQSYVARLNDWSNIYEVIGPSTPHNGIWNGMRRCTVRLQEFIKEFAGI